MDHVTMMTDDKNCIIMGVCGDTTTQCRARPSTTAYIVFALTWLQYELRVQTDNWTFTCT